MAALVVGEGETLRFEADATDSSGGTGAPQPAPEAMQVKYVAEGLDGLAAALESAMDGAAPRNIGPGGTPVSAPLIGTDLDAGAGVPAILTGLTSKLRTELAKVDADTAVVLEEQLEAAVKRGVDSASGLEDVALGDVTATVTCGGTAGACEPCPEPEEDEEPVVCRTEGPTGWDTVSISTTLAGSTKTGKTPFDTGLPGLEVRSDELVDTETSWTLPITLELARGVGPRVRINGGDALALDVEATIPAGFRAIVGYLPAAITAEGEAGSVHTVVDIAPEAGTWDLFQLYDGDLTAQSGFTNPSGHTEHGITLKFETLAGAGDAGAFDLLGNIDLPWTAGSAPDAGFGDITYNDVKLDVGEVVAAIATPFQVVDPYLAPVRDVMDVLRTPIPVVSDLAELGGGDADLAALPARDAVQGDREAAAGAGPPRDRAGGRRDPGDERHRRPGDGGSGSREPGRRRCRALHRTLRGGGVREVHPGRREHGHRDRRGHAVHAGRAEEDAALPGRRRPRRRQGEAGRGRADHRGQPGRGRVPR